MSRIILKSPAEIEKLRKAAGLVSTVLAEVGRRLAPGVDTLKLDHLAETIIRDNGGVPAFKNYRASGHRTPFPHTLCISVNDAVVHGMPGKHAPLKEGDVVSVDCGVLLDGYYGDSAYTFTLGPVAPAVQNLLSITRQSLEAGLQHAREGQRLGDLCHAIQAHIDAHHYGIVRELVGHGIGKHLHEAPEVPNYGRANDGIRLKTGMVFCVEPMVNLGTGAVYQDNDGWTIRTRDGQPSAHYEKMVAVGPDGPDVLTSFALFEQN